MKDNQPNISIVAGGSRRRRNRSPHKRLQFIVSIEEIGIIKSAAAIQSLRVSRWVAELAVRQARRVVGKLAGDYTEER